MGLYTTIHLHNVPAGGEADYAAWFEGAHRDDVVRLRGFRSADRFEVTPEQVMPDIPQPWRYMSVYDFELTHPEIDLPALGPLLAQARDGGLIDDATETERIYSYRLYSDWKSGPNHVPDKPFSSMFMILANFVAGMEEEYHRWYDEIHIPEVCRVPGFAAMRRGRLCEVQVEPRRFCPGSDVVMCGHQTDDLLFSIKDFSARARGVSPSGDQMEPRSKAGSFARTVHFFRKISGPDFWDGGMAYAGDLSVYPPDFRVKGA
ncbi:hypothetical protein H7F50_01130 [Novosphingobium flavum]|uniref:hypothetical protein n=1 Tax=Novosphingobium aerophilum TaxID=2839843 RepID=UPI001639F9BB|nr:hypothetical protein [Novosphingobium aerophilum]MBC2660342.1 hypothetical protein [Novosphingobium aerophilum]